MTHNGQITIFKDCIITNDHVFEWDWSIDGTRHNPGITPKAVTQLLELEDCDIILLSQGMHLKLGVCKETIRRLKKAGKEVEILETENTVKRWNELCTAGESVGALIHSTC